MRAFPTTAAAGILLLAAFVFLGCGPTDPLERALDERAQWNVELLDWAQSPDGTITLSARVSGPPQAELDTLTVRLLFQDGAGGELERRWWSIDLTDVERGGPADRMLRVAGKPGVEGIGIDPVLLPSDAEIGEIPELKL